MSGILREAVEYIVSLGKANVIEVNEKVYSDKPLTPCYRPTQATLNTETLTSIVDYIKRNTDGCRKRGDVVVHVESPIKVSVFSNVNAEMRRNEYIIATAMLPRFDFGYFYDTENFNILMQSVFERNEDADILLRVVGNLKDEAVKTLGDDGVSQAVTIKSGIATVADVKVPNPVTLKPYRTFLEAEQPESKFIFRMRDGGRCALFEADGGAWKREAINSVTEYLQNQLSDEIKEGMVIILA